MFEKLRILFATGQITEEELTNAVSLGWITEDQKAEIMKANF